jgi:hypothetical protein
MSELANTASKAIQLCKLMDVKDKVVVIWSDTGIPDSMDIEHFNQFAQAYKDKGALEVILLPKGAKIEAYTDKQLEQIGLRRTEDAIKERQGKESSIQQHSRVKGCGISTKASSGDSIEHCTQVEEKEVVDNTLRTTPTTEEYLRRILANTQHLYSDEANMAFGDAISRAEHVDLDWLRPL